MLINGIPDRKEDFMLSAIRFPDRAAWHKLREHAKTVGAAHLRDLFAQDPERGDRMAIDELGLYFNYAKHRVTDETLRLLVQLAEESDLRKRIDAMFRGDRINVTEHRAVLHVALRAPRAAHIEVDGENVVPDVHAVLDKMSAFAERVRGGAWLGFTGQRIRNVVNIGIGGSDLGPVMAYEALRHYSERSMTFRFVSNVDGTDFAEAVLDLDPAETLFIVASKTFTTQETMTNAHSARRWLLAALEDERAVANHFVAVSTNATEVAKFGIDTANMFGFWDWVGGRYSMDSAIGLSTMLAIGPENFRAMLAGFHAMDEHFRTAPLARNLPVRLGLLDVWYRNFHGFNSRCIAPYHAYLRRLPAYLQQLEMESNGKQVDRQGRLLPMATSPVLWGEPGSNGQHAFFQMLHQGGDVLPLEIVAVRQCAHPLAGHHGMLLANALAQSQALMEGRPSACGHRHFSGNRPSSFLLLEALTPQSLGALIALQEHRVFVSGSLWGINSFDQWGVELGKVLARDLEQRLASGDVAGLDASTAGLLQRLRAE